MSTVLHIRIKLGNQSITMSTEKKRENGSLKQEKITTKKTVTHMFNPDFAHNYVVNTAVDILPRIGLAISINAEIITYNTT